MNIDERRPLQRLLAFDTSTSSLAVAVMENGILLAERNIHAERNHSAYLVTAIDEALSAAGITKRELDAIAVGVGPGSYTGIRIAVTTAKTMAWALKLPVFGVSSLEALGLGGWAQGTGQDALKLSQSINQQEQEDTLENEAVSSDEYWIVPLVDARRGQVYTSCFTASQDRMPKRTKQDGIRLMDNWSHELADKLSKLDPQNRPSAIWFVGETLPVHEAAANEALLPFGVALYFAQYELEGVWVGLAGTRRVLTGTNDEIHTLEPNYTQLAEAEVQAKAKAKLKAQAEAEATASTELNLTDASSHRNG